VTLKIMKSFYLHRQRRQEGGNWKERWSSCEILFAQYEEKTVLSVGYMALFILRGMIFNLTVALLYNFPLVQSIIITIANLLMFGYILYLRPLKELFGVAQLFVTEGIVNIVSICVLILAIMDKANIESISTRRDVGNVMAFLIQSFNTLALVFMGISISLFLIFVFRIWKLFRSQGIKSPLKMLEKVLLSGLDEETIKNAGNQNSLVKILARKPKIRRPPRREKSTVAQGLSNAPPVIHLESLNNSVANLPVAEGSMNCSEESFVQNRPDIPRLQLPLPNEELDTTKFYSTQTIFEPYPKEDPERSFQGLTETVGKGDIQNTGGNILEETRMGSPLRRAGIVEDWDRLKAKMKRLTNQGPRVRGYKEWREQLKKLKTRLKDRPKTPVMSLEDRSGNSS